MLGCAWPVLSRGRDAPGLTGMLPGPERGNAGEAAGRPRLVVVKVRLKNVLARVFPA